jgi:hypothetical protein
MTESMLTPVPAHPWDPRRGLVHVPKASQQESEGSPALGPEGANDLVQITQQPAGKSLTLSASVSTAVRGVNDGTSAQVVGRARSTGPDKWRAHGKF